MSTMPESSDLTGQTLDGRYRLDRLLGQGGMGHVYEGVHVILGRKIAVKTLHPRLANDARFRERFLREAKSASTIQHPNVVQIMDFGYVPDGSVYFVMEHLAGRDLGMLLREQGKLPWPRVRALLLQAVRALAAAHAHNIIHRDIKPGNCFLTGSGETDVVKLLDFGIAKIVKDDVEEDGERLTGTGEVFGTATYMAPEQASGETLDARSDIYSLGVMAYEMLTGQVPFRGANAIQVITKHLTERPRPLHELEPSIPAAVEALVLRAMAKDPNHRFASMVEVAAALEAIPADGSVRSGIPAGAISNELQWRATRPASALDVGPSLMVSSANADTAEATNPSRARPPASASAPPKLPTSSTATTPRGLAPQPAAELGPSNHPASFAPTVALAPESPTTTRPLMDAASPATLPTGLLQAHEAPSTPSGPILFGHERESTHPPPGQVDQSTAPLLLLTQPTGVGSESQHSGAMMADTSVHHVEPFATPSPKRQVGLMLGVFLLVSVASVVGTLTMLASEAEPVAKSSVTVAPTKKAIEPAKTGEPQQPTPEPSPPKDVIATPPIPAASAETPMSSGDGRPAVEAAPGQDRVASDVKGSHRESEGPPGGSERGATAKHPMHLTQACVERRERAAKALKDLAWRDVLSATSVAACWPTAEQDERRSMRVMAYLDLGEFEKCVATGRGAQDKQTQNDVKRCKELLEE